MTEYPKKKRIKLPPKEYHELRRKIYDKQLGLCKGCGFWFPFDEFSIHHRNTGGMAMRGDDTEENIEGGYCVGCHPD